VRVCVRVVGLAQRLPLRILEDVRQCTYLVTDKIRRTFKLLYAVSQAMPVVTQEWITETLQAGRVLRTRLHGELPGRSHAANPVRPEPVCGWGRAAIEPYHLKDRETEKTYDFTLAHSMELARQRRVLAGWSVYAVDVASLGTIKADDYLELVAANGGTVRVMRGNDCGAAPTDGNAVHKTHGRLAGQILHTEAEVRAALSDRAERVLIIGAEGSREALRRLLEGRPGTRVYTYDFLLSTFLSQELPLNNPAIQVAWQ